MKDNGYTIRYERGTFLPGYCILENKKVIVVNKFYDTESRINTLLEILPKLNINEGLFTEESAEFYDKLELIKPEE